MAQRALYAAKAVPDRKNIKPTEEISRRALKWAFVAGLGRVRWYF
jgi:hypothetical protein